MKLLALHLCCKVLGVHLLRNLKLRSNSVSVIVNEILLNGLLPLMCWVVIAFVWKGWFGSLTVSKSSSRHITLLCFFKCERGVNFFVPTKSRAIEQVESSE